MRRLKRVVAAIDAGAAGALAPWFLAEYMELSRHPHWLGVQRSRPARPDLPLGSLFHQSPECAIIVEQAVPRFRIPILDHRNRTHRF
jgi:hypothetical protein